MYQNGLPPDFCLFASQWYLSLLSNPTLLVCTHAICIERSHGPGTFDRLAINECARLIIIQTSQMFLIPESKSTHFQSSEVMLLIVIRILSRLHDFLCFSNVPRTCQQYCGEPLSGGGSWRQRAAYWGTSPVQKVAGSVIRGISRRGYIQLERGCGGNRSAGRCFRFCLSCRLIRIECHMFFSLFLSLLSRGFDSIVTPFPMWFAYDMMSYFFCS